MEALRIESIADHLDLIPKLAEWHYREWGHLDPFGSLESWTEGLRLRAGRDRIPMTYIALRGTQLLGSAALVDNDMRTRPDLWPWLAGVYVQEPCRGQGIGSALVRQVMRKAAEMGIERLYLYTHSARPFYEKLGWECLAEVDYEGREVVVMAVELKRDAARDAGANGSATGK